MPDYQQVISTSTLIHTGPGYLSGLVASGSSGSSARVTCYDNTCGTGTIILDLYIAPYGISQPFPLFFTDRTAPRFATGLYITITNATVTLWARGV